MRKQTLLLQYKTFIRSIWDLIYLINNNKYMVIPDCRWWAFWCVATRGGPKNPQVPTRRPPDPMASSWCRWGDGVLHTVRTNRWRPEGCTWSIWPVLKGLLRHKYVYRCAIKISWQCEPEHPKITSTVKNFWKVIEIRTN